MLSGHPADHRLQRHEMTEYVWSALADDFRTFITAQHPIDLPVMDVGPCLGTVVSGDPPDGPIAFAGGPFQSFSIPDCHYATRVFDYSCFLQASGCNRNAGTSAA